jgi:hypothetical protein
MNYKDKFLNLIKSKDAGWKGFHDNHYSKDDTIQLTEELSNEEFDSLYYLRLKRDENLKYKNTRGITKRYALRRISELKYIKEWHIEKIFRSICEYGFFTLSNDEKEALNIDPGFDYSPLFFWYTNLMKYFKIGELEGFDNLEVQVMEYE